ncbi:hypothetical protein GCM10009804_36470 [Kribbella hippodromi]|uniref:Uncharacterized protein n=1 Tax=Kribbella hippodromi TaxID=434347 RepID=A0ABP4P9U3_9ACTN
MLPARPKHTADHTAASDRGLDVPGRSGASGMLRDTGHTQVRRTDARRGDHDDEQNPPQSGKYQWAQRMPARRRGRGLRRHRTRHHRDRSDEQQRGRAVQSGRCGHPADQGAGDQRSTKEKAFLGNRIKRVRAFFQY